MLSAMQNGQEVGSSSCEFQTHVILLTATRLDHWAIGLYWFIEENCIWLVTSSNFEPFKFFCMQDCCSLIAQVEYQGGNLPEFLTTKLVAAPWHKPFNRLLLINIITWDIDWSWNIFTLHNFGSMPLEQLIDLRKVWTDSENLKFRTNLVMDFWSVTQ